MTPPPQAADLDHKKALAFLAYLLCGFMVGHGVVHVSLIKNNSFAVWRFLLLQKIQGQLPFSAIQHSKMFITKGKAKWFRSGGFLGAAMSFEADS